MTYAATVAGLLAGLGSWLLGWHLEAVVLYVAAGVAYAVWFASLLRRDVSALPLPPS